MRVVDTGRPNRKLLTFACPRRAGHECEVMLKPWPISNGNAWDWDGNEIAPTLSPSIDCQGCDWHGHIIKGEIVG